MKRAIGNPFKKFFDTIDYIQVHGISGKGNLGNAAASSCSRKIYSCEVSAIEQTNLKERLKERTYAQDKESTFTLVAYNQDIRKTKGMQRILTMPNPSLTITCRPFSSSGESDLSDTETIKSLYDKMMNSITEKKSAPPNAWLWAFIAKCSSKEDIELLFDMLKKLRIFRLSKLRIYENFNTALCREVTKSCVRVGAIEFGMKAALWKHNVFGLTPDIGSAHHLLLYAKQNSDVNLLDKVMKLVKKNEVTLQAGTADIVFSICSGAGRWDLITKYGKKFVKSGVKLRQTSFDIWMEFAARKGDVESLWKIEKWRSKFMIKHSFSTGFSCAKGFLLEDKPESAAATIQILIQTVPDSRRANIEVELGKLANEWPLQVIKHNKKENEEAFAAKLQDNISALINALQKSGIDSNIAIQDLS